MKKTYDLAPNFKGSAHAWDYGMHERHFEAVYTTHAQFPSEDYVTVECPRAFYRIHRSNLDDPQIVKFLRMANRLTPKED